MNRLHEIQFEITPQLTYAELETYIPPNTQLRESRSGVCNRCGLFDACLEKTRCHSCKWVRD